MSLSRSGGKGSRHRGLRLIVLCAAVLIGSWATTSHHQWGTAVAIALVLADIFA